MSGDMDGHTKCKGDGEVHVDHKVGGQTLHVTCHALHVTRYK